MATEPPATTADTTPLLRLLYVSRNLIGTEATEAEIGRILAVARPRNAALGVTGALLFGEDCFAQALEGPPAAVEAVLGLIRRDPRHDRIVVLEARAVERREFGAWSMACAGRRSGAPEARFATLAGADAGAEGVRRLAALLQGVVGRATGGQPSVTAGPGA